VKIVLDTNVLVSGIFFSGPPAQILRAFGQSKLRLIVTPEILEEYKRVAAELHDHFPGIEISRILELIVIGSEICVPVELEHPICTDPKDDKFFAAAISGGAKVIVSGDKHLLKVSGAHGISVLTPRSFIDRYKLNAG
jgi:putative PIN family toxin of toxin-antitoxin system